MCSAVLGALYGAAIFSRVYAIGAVFVPLVIEHGFANAISVAQHEAADNVRRQFPPP